MNAYYPAERFLEIIENASGEDSLFSNKGGVLSATVHTGRTIEAFDLKIEFPYGSVLITASSFLGVNEKNYDCVRALLESINDLIQAGIFFIDEDNIISFSTRCELDDLISVDNPFDIVFSGCEAFGMFEKAILKSLTGTNIFYMNNLQ